MRRGLISTVYIENQELYFSKQSFSSIGQEFDIRKEFYLVFAVLKLQYSLEKKEQKCFAIKLKSPTPENHFHVRTYAIDEAKS